MVQKLTEIKKGQVGTGLLIENDGYVSLDMKENKLKILKKMQFLYLDHLLYLLYSKNMVLRMQMVEFILRMY